MRRIRRTTALAAGVVLVGLTAACGGGTTGEAASPTPSDSAASGGDVRIGLAISTLNNPFFVQLRDGAQQAADAAGVELTVTDAQNDASQQANQMQNFATQRLDAVIINPVDSDAAGPMVQGIGDIPVIAVDRAVNGAEVTSYIASDNVLGGKLAAEELAKQIGEKGQVVVLQGIPGTSASRDRGAGFERGIAAFPDITVVAKQPADFDRARGLDVMTNLLQAHPDVVGVFAENDEMALGAVTALGERAGSSVKVVGFDGTPDALAAIKRGTMGATIAQLPAELGKQAVQTAIRIARGETVDKETMIEVVVVTKDNVADFE